MVNEIVLYEANDKSIVLPVQVSGDTVWLNRMQMTELFDRDVKTIGKHIVNTLKEEVDRSVVAKFATVQNEGGREVNRSIQFYNLDMIISVGLLKRTDDTHQVLDVVEKYSEALDLPDSYDHQNMTRPKEKEMMISVIMNCLK